MRRSGVPGARLTIGALTLAVAVLLAGCGGPTTATPPGSAAVSLAPPVEATPGASVPALGSPVTGVLTHIDSTGLANVTGFTLRLDDGRVVTFRIGVLENGAQFPPGHLAEHLSTAAPVRVFFRPAGADLVVYRIEDAG